MLRCFMWLLTPSLALSISDTTSTADREGGTAITGKDSTSRCLASLGFDEVKKP